MSFAQLKPEIISHIFTFLVPRLPTPMSGCTKEEYAYCSDDYPDMITMLANAVPGAKLRDEIRANELAVLMRTSINMNHHAAFHLYRTVITDSLPLLFAMHDRPPANPHILSKDRLLGQIRNLHIEYGDKVAQPSYRSIMRDPQCWVINGNISRWTKATELANYETVALSTMFLTLSRRSPKGKRLPSLRNLSVCAIFGAHERLEFFVGHPRNGIMFNTGSFPKEPGCPALTAQLTMGELIQACSLSMEGFFRRSPLLHYCQRGVFGPLSLPRTLELETAIPKSTNTLFTMHLDASSTQVQAASGYRTRFLFENQARNEFTTNGLIRTTSRLLDELDEKLEKGVTDGNYKIEIFASSDRHHLPGVPFGNEDDSPAIFATKPMEEASLIDAIWLSEDEARRAVDLKSPQGIVRWRPARESPACEACLWAYEEEDKSLGTEGHLKIWWMGE